MADRLPGMLPAPSPSRPHASRSTADLLAQGRGGQNETDRYKIGAGPYGPGRAQREADLRTWTEEQLVAAVASAPNPQMYIDEINQRYNERANAYAASRGR